VTDKPLVTVIVPARNEQDDICRCIEAIAAQDYGVDHIELMVVDGDSSDGTILAAKTALAPHPFLRAEVVSNPTATTPSNLNRGLDHATGEIVCRVDARSLIEPHHVRVCVDVLTGRPEVIVVGGAQWAEARSVAPVAAGIARALNNRYTMGLARYRRHAADGPSDTVYLGAFRTAELRRAGGWDERFGTNQDFELNRRLSRDGVVWFASSLRVRYLPRPNLRELWAQYVRFGRAKVRYWRLTGDRPRPRQLVLLAGPPLLGGVVLGLLARRVGPWALPLLAAGAFGVEHAGAAKPAPAGPLARVVSVAAIGCVSGGWTAGIWLELLHTTSNGGRDRGIDLASRVG
jgi:glycosyltransferase involved in cell wall biosynthesis